MPHYTRDPLESLPPRGIGRVGGATGKCLTGLARGERTGSARSVESPTHPPRHERCDTVPPANGR